jgi:hypothetical protein
MLIDAHAIAKERTTALMRARINRKDRDAATRGACDVGKCCSE